MKKVFLKLLILPFLLGLSVPVHAGDVAVMMSANVRPSRGALLGFKKTLRHRIVTEFDMKGDPDRGRKALTDIQSKINPNLIFTIGTPALQVAARKTTIPPVVYAMVFNPISIIGAGVKNITGVSMNVSVEQTILLFKDLSPKIRRVGVVFNPARSGHFVMRAALVARKHGVQLVTRKIRYPREAIKALNSLQDKIDALWILPDETILVTEVVQYMLLFSSRNKVPVLGLSEKQTQMGALLSLSYGSSRDMGRQAGEMANSILSGKKPAMIPYTTPRQVKLTVNLRAAQKLGVEIPNRVLEKADNAVKAPVYRDGDWWVFRVEEGGESEEYRVTYKNGKFESDDPEFLTGGDDPAFLLFGPLVSVHLNDPENRWLDFPLVAGKKWSFRYRQGEVVSKEYSFTANTGEMYSGTWHSDAEVIGPVPEPVETPAGKFKVIEIRRKDISRDERDLTYFYSPKTKTVVKFEIREIPTSLRHGGRHTRLDLVKYGHEAPTVGVPVVKAPATKMPVREIDWSSVKAPVYKDGDWWVFRVKGEGRPSEEYRVTYKNGKFDSDDPEFLTGSDESYSFVFGPLVSVHLNDPKKRWLDFPLVAGKKWDFAGFLWPEDTVKTRMWNDAEAEIIGPAPQPVETPAGKFKVIEIRQVFERQYYFLATRVVPEVEDFTIDLVYFYSPRTKSVVKQTTHLVSTHGDEAEYEMELIEYGHEAPAVGAPVVKAPK